MKSVPFWAGGGGAKKADDLNRFYPFNTIYVALRNIIDKTQMFGIVCGRALFSEWNIMPTYDSYASKLYIAFVPNFCMSDLWKEMALNNIHVSLSQDIKTFRNLGRISTFLCKHTSES